jgi:hypothetical protein
MGGASPNNSLGLLTNSLSNVFEDWPWKMKLVIGSILINTNGFEIRCLDMRSLKHVIHVHALTIVLQRNDQERNWGLFELRFTLKD